MQNPNTFLDAGWDFLGERRNGLCEIWMIPAGNEYPELSVPNGYAPPLLTGAGTNEDPYVIETPEDLGTVWHRPRACYQLGSDIDLSGIVWSAAIVPVFTGRFDGHGHKIQDVTICGGGYLGLFGILDSNAVLFDLDLEDVSVVGMEYVGGLAGCSWGTISSCQSTGSVNGTDVVGGLVGHAYGGTVSKSCSAGSVSGTFFVGGLVGLNRGIVSSSYSTGSVSGTYYVGGLLGNNRNTASNDYSAGSVSGTHFVGGLVGLNGGLAPYSTVSKSYSTGLVKGETCVGGLVGDNLGDDSVSNCFWDVTTSCQSRSAGGSGLTSDQMREVQTFLDAHWDFVEEAANGTEDIWWIDEGKDYPRLWWEAHD